MRRPISVSEIRQALAVSIALFCGIVPAPSAAPTLVEALDDTNLVWQSGGQALWFGQTNLTHDGSDAAQSGSITNAQESWVQTTVTGPGPLTFWWNVSSELGYDQLQFLIDGVEQVNISGEVNWQEHHFDVPSGTHFLRWRYVKDDSESSGLDHAWLDQVTYVPPVESAPTILEQPASQTVAAGAIVSFVVTASGQPEPTYRWNFNGTPFTGATNSTLTLNNVTTNQAGIYRVVVSNYLGSVTSAPAILTVTLMGEAVDAPDLAWVLGGNASWIGQTAVTHDGSDAAESGMVMNNQQSWVQTTVTGPGVLTFWWKVSSEPFYDGLQFLTNGVVAASLSGEAQWEQKTFALPRSTVNLRWRYFKDGSITIGQDKGWLDQVSFVPDKAPLPFYFTSVRLLSNQRIEMTLNVETNRSYYIAGSTDLLNWIVLTNFQSPTGAFSFVDSWSTNRPRRFYRAFVP